MPVMVTVGDKQGGCPIDKLIDCPVEWQMARSADGPIVQCRNPQTPEAVEYFREGCPDVYVLCDDPETKVATDPQQMDIRVGTA